LNLVLLNALHLDQVTLKM